MKTKFKLIFEGKPDLELDKFKQSLPENFHVITDKEEIYVEIESLQDEDEECQYIIDRELDRVFFLTCVKIKAEMVRKIITSTLTVSYRIHGDLPQNIGPQNWNNSLPIQLRLWSVAIDHNDILTKLLLYFQIIELEYPTNSDHYPKYDDFQNLPHPLTECKFVRHLIVHSGEVSDPRLNKYCEYLGVPSVMLDITNSNYYGKIKSKLPLLEAEAKKVIENALTSGST